MKKGLLIFCTFALLSTAIFGESYIKVSSDELSFKVPAGWNITYNDDNRELLFIINSPTYDNDEFVETISVEADFLEPSERFTSKSYLDALLKDLKNKHKDSYELIDRNKDMAAARYIHTEINGGTDVVQFIRIIIKSNVAYIICATALPETIKSFEDDFNEIMLSFK